MKRILAAVMVGVFLFGISCRDSVTVESSTESSLTVATDLSIGEATQSNGLEVNILAEDLVIENLQIDSDDADNVCVSGQISEHIQIDAALVSTVDPNEPGEGKVYSADLKIFPESIRHTFVQPDWKAKDFDVWFKYDFANSNSVYFDTYEDKAGNRFIYLQATSFLEYCTFSGYLMNFLFPDQSVSSSEDFIFINSQTALDNAKNFLARVGIAVCDYHILSRISREEFLYEAEVRDNHRVEDDPPEDAYCFSLFQNLDGLPIARESYISIFPKEIVEPHGFDEVQRIMGTEINLIITQKGIEYAQISDSYENITEISSGAMCSLDDALNTYAQFLYSATETINANDVFLYDSEPIYVESIALMQVPIQDIESEDIVIRPCWVISSTQRDPNITDYEVLRSSRTYIDSLTGEVLNTRYSNYGESA